MEELGEGRGDPMPRVDIDTEFVVSAAEVLDECVPVLITCTERSLLSPRIALSRAFNGPWAVSTALFAYCSITWHAAGSSSSSTRR